MYFICGFSTNVVNIIFCFSHEKISGLACSSFPGPGDKHIYTFNPMKEFIHPASDSHVDFEFGKFKTKHGRNYNNEKEHALRKDIFRQNVRYIHSVNRQSRGTFVSTT